MKKMLNLFLIIVTVLSLIGCSSINEVDEDKVKDVSDKITEAIINTVGKSEAYRQESHTINAGNLNTLNINSSVGDIKIDTHKSNDVLIGINIVAKSGSEEKSEQLVEDFDYTVDESLNSIDVDTTYKDIKLEDYNISTELSITVPENITNIIISLNVGNVNIKNIKGKFEVQNNVGNIVVENSQGSYSLKTNVGEINLYSNADDENSEFITNTGDIKLSFNDISNADSIKAVTDIGDITITIPDNSSYEAVINEFMGKEKTESNGDKRTKLEIRTGVGSINFN